MIILAILGIIINGIATLKLKESKKVLNKTVMLHLLEDFLGWISIFIASIIIYFTNFYFLDPILSFIICFIILRNIFINLKNSLKIIMQANPDIKAHGEIKEGILKIKGVNIIKEFNIWSLDGEEHIATMQIKKNDSTNNLLLINQIKQIL